MERLKKYVADWLENYDNQVEIYKHRIEKSFFFDFLKVNAKSFVQLELSYRYFVDLIDMLEENVSKDEIKSYIELTIKEFEKILLTQKVSTTTNRMYNLIKLWEQENYQSLHKQFKIMLNYLN